MSYYDTATDEENQAAMEKVNAINRADPVDAFARVAQYQEPGTEAATRYPEGAGKRDYNAGTVNGGVPSASPSAYPATDTGVANAMDRADLGNRTGFGSPDYVKTGDQPSAPGTVAAAYGGDIAQRRSEIADQRKEASATLANLSGRTDKIARQQRLDTIVQMRGLENEDQHLVTQQQRAAVFSAKQADETVAREAHARAADGYTKLSLALADINRTTPKGPDYDKKVASWILANKDDPGVAEIIGTKGFQDKLKPHLDSSKATQDTIDALVASGHGIEATHVGPQGTSYKVTPPSGGSKDVPPSILETYAKLSDVVAQHEQAAKTEEASNISAKKSGVPYSKSAQLDANLRAMSVIESNYPSLAPKAAAAPAATPAPPSRPAGPPTLKYNPKTHKLE